MIDLRVLKKSALLIAFIALGGGFLVPVAPAHAAPLTPEKCEALITEHADLLADNVKSDLAKGPEWAKDNLDQVRLDKIKRLIEVEESVAFRCRGTPLMTAVLIPSLADVNQPKQKKIKASAARAPGALRISRVPPPVRRPRQKTSRTTASEAKAVPKAVRKRPTAKSTSPKSKAKIRRVRKTPRRKTRRAADAYVPPPLNPAYQPSLMSP